MPSSSEGGVTLEAGPTVTLGENEVFAIRFMVPCWVGSTTVSPQGCVASVTCCLLCGVQSGPLCPEGTEEGQEGSWLYVSVVTHFWETVEPLANECPAGSWSS